MICYRDKTFCPFWENCKLGKNCNRALTEQVKKEAAKWWGKENPPISVYTYKPNCYKLIINENKEC